MYRWCAYCQSYMGRKEPLSDYNITHGICGQCKSRQDQTAFDPDGLTDIIAFYETINSGFKNSSHFDLGMIIAEARKLKIRPADLLIGIIQPLLYQIGTKYQQGEVTILEEHRFSLFTRRLTDKIILDYHLKPSPDKPADIWIFSADGDYHEFGPRFLEVFFLQEGLCAEAVTPGLPTEIIYRAALEYLPKIICISTTLSEHFEQLIPTLEIFNKWDESNKPLIIIGGQGAKADYSSSIPDIIIHTGTHLSLLSIIEQQLKLRS
jgi:methanogenic corrinoid protein MtbC1